MKPMMSKVHTFQQDAMNTTYTFRIVHDDKGTAQAASHAAVELLEKLENLMSRYIPGSDIWQINHMEAGDSLFIDDLTYLCLRKAVEMHAESGGLFDISLGLQIEHLKTKESGSAPALSGALNIDPEKPAVHCLEAGREIDLGGIGKGFALDCIRKELSEWNIQSALLSSGASTHLAYGDRTWPIELTGRGADHPIQLQNMALSISGADVQGEHIVSPIKTSEQASQCKRIWVQHKEAAFADAWSTACYLMSEAQLELHRESLTIITGD